MARPKILTYPHEKLSRPASFDWLLHISEYDLKSQVQIALGLLRDTPGAAAIAANQLGFNGRWFVVNKDISDAAGLRTQVVYDPSYDERPDDVMCVDFEGCLSFPGIRVPVPRPEKLLMMFDREPSGNFDCIELSGFPARVACHEIDHLHGKLMVDYLPRKQKFEIRSQMLKRK